MNTNKRFLAILMAVVMVLGLAACGQKGAQNSQHNGDASNTRVVGMLVFSTDASLNISYNDQGTILALEGTNDEGITLAEAFPDCVGMTCGDLVAELIKKCASQNTLTENVILKQSFGSKLPGADFLNDLVSKAQAAADEANMTTNVIQIPAENLDENGYINVDTAKTILLNKLGLEKAAILDCVSTPDVNREYMLYVEDGEIAGTFMVNAVTGITRQLTEEELRELEGVSGEEEIPVEEEGIDVLPTEENTEPTTPTEAAPSDPADVTVPDEFV